jgi:hypothetical protein
MDKLFEISKPYEEFKHILERAIEADDHIYLQCRKYPCSKFKYGCDCEHKQNLYIISNTKIKKNESYAKIILKNKIKNIYFLYHSLNTQHEDLGEGYWFCIGQLKNGSYFAFETDCCYTGFGFGEESYIYISKHKELLYNFGLTDKHRLLISNNIEERFFIIQGKLIEKENNGKKIQNCSLYYYESDEDLFKNVSLSPNL